MLTIRAAASLLSQSFSPEGLVTLAHAVGCTGTPDALDLDTCTALGLGSEVTEASVVAGPGSLRALVLTACASTSLRDLISRVATRLAARTPHTLWILVVGQRAGTDIAIATWHSAALTASGRGRPRVAALVADRDAIVDSDADTLRSLAAAGGDDDLTTHARWIDILGREALSRRFFKTLERLVDALARSATIGNEEARAEIALLYASRLLFLAFLEAKGWLDGDRGFLARQFDDCMRTGGKFHERVLLPLFFGTLNTPVGKRSRVARTFGRVPFLNGGLFTPTAIERRHRPLRFDDSAIGSLFGELFTHYRFTAREESATFHEAAIDPEMLGRAFESLMVFRSRRATGAFYTPQDLVDRVAMCGLEDALATSLGEPLAARVMRGDGPLLDEDRRRAREAIGHLTILDPACGSGAFLVHLLDRLATLARELGDERPLDAIRRDMLTRSIFGVDVNPTAVWLCELRLWLAVVIDGPDDSGTRVTPLPNLDRNIRVGDSLAGPGFLSPTLAIVGGQAICRLRDRYTRATGPRKHALGRALDREERRVVIATIDAQLQAVHAARRDVVAARRGRDLFGERNTAGGETLRRATELRRRSAVLRVARARLVAGGALPFSFPAHFADIAGAGGFRLIIGNPPWVRPHRLPAAERARYRRAYRVARAAPWRAGATGAGAGHGFAAQVDLAALFVERSLLLLRPGGTLAMLLPAKLWRSLSGGGMRQLLMSDAQLRRLEDYSDARAAFDASVYPGLLVARSVGAQASADTPVAHVVAAIHRAGAPTVSRIATQGLALDQSAGAPWMLLPREVRAAFDHLREAGAPLGESVIGRAHLGVKCGLNDAFLVRCLGTAHGEAEILAMDGRLGKIESSLLRPVARGENVAPWTITREDRFVLWTHDVSGAPIAALPPLAATWLARWRRGLMARTDARSNARWWSLFRTEAARSNRSRVIWADIGRAPRAAVLLPHDPIVPLNSCYAVHCRDDDDAFAFAALLNSPIAAAWLNVLAEPARGGYRRYLGWTMSLVPLPLDWECARKHLAAIGRAATDAPKSVSSREAARGRTRGLWCEACPDRTAPGLERLVSVPCAEAALLLARNRIARAVLAKRSTACASLGSVTLREHQRDGASQLLRMLRREGGALLADHVGVGKTYTALAVAARYTSPLVIAPAALRDVWHGALKLTGIDATVLSMEGLSREDAPAAEGHDLVIIDEAHHLRSPGTHRYQAVATLCRQAHVLLLSATPVQNRRRDLEAQLALFLGSRAAALGDAELAAHVVRRSPDHAGLALPCVDGPHGLTVAEDDDCLRAIMAIPPPLPAADEGVAAVLMMYSLVHLWASSRAALAASLRRRRARAMALQEAMTAGRHPTKRELAAWCFDGSAIQLAFPDLVVDAALDRADVTRSLDHLDRYCAAIADLLASLVEPNPDHTRAQALTALCKRHPDSRVVAFSQYAETVRAYTRELRQMAGVAELTARGARIASGPVSRREVIEQFLPSRTSKDATPRSRRIDLLVTTDLLSEGVDLHGASVVVHLDLPWNPARIEQRVGRLRRLGSPHACVHAYAMMPPAAAERMLEIERRLRDKLSVAASTVGTAGVAPFARKEALLAGKQDRSSPAELMQSTREIVSRWLCEEPTNMSAARQVVAAARAATSATGFLALVECDDEPHLLASFGGSASTDPAVVHAAVRCVAGAEIEVQPAALDAALAEVETWMRRRRIAKSVGVEDTGLVTIRRTTLERVAQCVARAPRHRRATFVSLAATARTVLSGRLSAGAERNLTALWSRPLDDEAWLRALGAVHMTDLAGAATNDPALHATGSGARGGNGADGIRVLILIEYGRMDI